MSAVLTSAAAQPGVAFVLDAMGEGLHSIVDVTIAYPAGTPSLLDLLADRVGGPQCSRRIGSGGGAGRAGADREVIATEPSPVRRHGVEKDRPRRPNGAPGVTWNSR